MHGFSRYAVFFAPRSDSPLGRFGASWLGWDAEHGCEKAPADVAGLPRPRAELVAPPRRYGFHGTLKAPFRLAEGADAVALDAGLAALAAEHAPFHLPVGLAELGAFLALTPVGAAPALDALAADCVRRLDRFRAPLSAAELARRDPARLRGREAEHLAAWGYPYVLDCFRFHLTLTGALARADQLAVRAALEGPLAEIVAAPLAFEDLCLFGEAPDGMFRVLARRPLGGPTAGSGVRASRGA